MTELAIGTMHPFNDYEQNIHRAEVLSKMIINSNVNIMLKSLCSIFRKKPLF